MALRTPQPPLASRTALLEGLRRLSPPGVLGGATPAAPTDEEAPQRVYFCRLDSAAKGDGLTHSEPVGWRYLVKNTGAQAYGGSPDTVGMVDVVEKQGEHLFSQLTQSWIGDAFKQAISKLRTSPRVQSSDFELRLLRIPALLLDAIWLKAKSEKDDLVAPVACPDSRVSPDTLYRADEFAALVSTLAAERQKLEGQLPEELER
jgi:hypothetical protein